MRSRGTWTGRKGLTAAPRSSKSCPGKARAAGGRTRLLPSTCEAGSGCCIPFWATLYRKDVGRPEGAWGKPLRWWGWSTPLRGAAAGLRPVEPEQRWVLGRSHRCPSHLLAGGGENGAGPFSETHGGRKRGNTNRWERRKFQLHV